MASETERSQVDGERAFETAPHDKQGPSREHGSYVFSDR